MASLAELVAYLDGYLRVREVPDAPDALNGLQVENGGRVERVVAAVDASLETIVAAGQPAGPPVAPGRSPGGTEGLGWVPTLLLVHHGLFWDGNVPLTGRRYRRVRALLDRDLALYSAHLPLDLHPEVGNNAVLARRLGIGVRGWWAEHRGVPIAVWGDAAERYPTREDLAAAVEATLETRVHLIPGGPTAPRRVGILTGAGGSAIGAAREAGLDTLITGEGAHHTYFDAMEWGINLLYAGHYATEQVGVQALGAHLAERFGIPWEFHRHPTGL